MMLRQITIISLFLMSAQAIAQSQVAPTAQQATGNVIFIHPDGASASTWTAGRALLVGPDNDLNWDLLPAIAVYRGHMADSLTATSNGGATTHAFGVKVASDAFGRTAAGERGERILDEHGKSRSIGHQALAAGLAVGLVQSGTSTEPGTACFLADADDRYDHDSIAAQLLESGADVILGGGERYFLPAGEQGVHGAGTRDDGRNLIDEARQLGFTVVFNRNDLLALSRETERVLGIFADRHTFNAMSEERLNASKLPHYQPDAPTIAEMTDVALRILHAKGKQFLLVVEEEGTDNFGNHNNAAGVFEAMQRTDESFGVARTYVTLHPRTLLITAADSDAGGMRMYGLVLHPDKPTPEVVPEHDRNGAPMDGVNGTGTAPFWSMPDRHGVRLPFAVAWASGDDVSGGVLVRAAGLNSHLVNGSMDNTDITRVMRITLFGSESEKSEDRRAR